jgi:CubicO group peptidase (beta-lactamase class C family)
VSEEVEEKILAYTYTRLMKMPRNSKPFGTYPWPARPVRGGIGDDSDLEKLWQEQGVSGGSGSLQQRVERALTLPLFEQPGTVWRYGGSADVLDRVMEVAAGQPFPEILKQRIFRPLGMPHTEHLPPPERQGDLARVYTQDENGELVLAPRRIDEQTDWTSGGGGLVSTIGDYLRFGLMLRNRGSLDGVKILEPETVVDACERGRSSLMGTGISPIRGLIPHPVQGVD